MERTFGCRRGIHRTTHSLTDYQRVRYQGGGGGAVSTSKSQSRQSSGTVFPSEFVSEAGKVVGQPLTLDELLAGMPQTTGLFGPPAPAPAPTRPGTAVPSGSVPPLDPGFGGGTVARPTGSTGAAPGGFVAPDPAALRHAATGNLLPGSYVPGVASIDPASTEPRSRIAPATADTGMGLFNRQGVANVGIGAAPTPAAAPGSVGVPSVTPASATAATGTLGPTGFDALRTSLFEQQYRPVEQEVNRQAALSDRSLAATLARSGLASSGAGAGQLATAQAQRNVQLRQAAQQAAQQATGQTLTLQEQELQANLGRQQEANLANAGFNQQAQVTNAANVLQGNTTNAANYLATLGLNEQQAQAARRDFLGYLGIQEQDLARMDQTNLANLSTMLNAWLQQYSTLGAIGRYGLGTSSASGFSLSGYAQGGAGGGSSSTGI